MPGVDESDVPEAEEGEEIDGALYDSGREYSAQLLAYKEFQGKAA
jgi:hypothetical protein